MKLIKYLVCGVLMTGSLAALTSCDDDKNYGDAPRLFSPVVKVTSSSNTLVCKWQGIKGAQKYQLTLLKETSLLDEKGDPIYEQVETIEAQASPYTFADLEWDDRYRVDIQAIGDGIESNVYKGEAITVTYPTKLKSVANVIDTGVKLEWNEDKTVATWTDVAYINVFTRNEDGSVTPYKPGQEDQLSRADKEEEVEKDPIVAPEENPDYYYTLTENDIRNSFCDIYGLQPATEYRVVAYNEDGEYRGRRDFKTKDAEIYDNPELVFDLRSEATDTIKNAFIETLPEGATVVLTGGKQYICSGTLKFTQSVKFTTGMSLSGQAVICSGGFAMEGDINRIEFNNVQLTCLPTDNKSSNFGGRYVFGDSKVYSVNEIVFENSTIKCERGIMRLRTKNQNVNNVLINNCLIDSIGGYGVCQLDASEVHVGTFTITNSTITNAERVLRGAKDNSGFDKVVVENVTFYGVSNEQQFFDMGTKDTQNPNLDFAMRKCIVGPGFTGKSIKGYRCNQGVAAFEDVYLTSDVQWVANKDTGEPMDPFGTYESMSQAGKDVWVAPEKGDFTLKSTQLPCSKAGDPRWYVQE